MKTKITVKTVLAIAFVGMCIGVTIGVVISLAMNYAFGGKDFFPSTPQILGPHFTSVTDAVAYSALLWALMGILFALTPLIFRKTDTLGLTKATALHFLMTFPAFTVLAILAGWFPLSFWFIASFILEFLVVYAVVWFIYYRIYKRKMEELNKKLGA